MPLGLDEIITGRFISLTSFAFGFFLYVHDYTVIKSPLLAVFFRYVNLIKRDGPYFLFVSSLQVKVKQGLFYSLIIGRSSPIL